MRIYKCELSEDEYEILHAVMQSEIFRKKCDIQLAEVANLTDMMTSYCKELENLELICEGRWYIEELGCATK